MTTSRERRNPNGIAKTFGAVLLAWIVMTLSSALSAGALASNDGATADGSSWFDLLVIPDPVMFAPMTIRLESFEFHAKSLCNRYEHVVEIVLGGSKRHFGTIKGRSGRYQNVAVTSIIPPASRYVDATLIVKSYKRFPFLGACNSRLGPYPVDVSPVAGTSLQLRIDTVDSTVLSVGTDGRLFPLGTMDERLAAVGHRGPDRAIVWFTIASAAAPIPDLVGIDEQLAALEQGVIRRYCGGGTWRTMRSEPSLAIATAGSDLMAISSAAGPISAGDTVVNTGAPRSWTALPPNPSAKARKLVGMRHRVVMLDSQQRVWAFNVTTRRWDPIAEGAVDIIAGEHSVYMVSSNGLLSRWSGNSTLWYARSTPAKQFAATSAHIYRLNNDGTIDRADETGASTEPSWQSMGNIKYAENLSATWSTLFFHGGSDIYRLDGPGRATRLTASGRNAPLRTTAEHAYAVGQDTIWLIDEPTDYRERPRLSDRPISLREAPAGTCLGADAEAGLKVNARWVPEMTRPTGTRMELEYEVKNQSSAPVVFDEMVLRIVDPQQRRRDLRCESVGFPLTVEPLGTVVCRTTLSLSRTGDYGIRAGWQVAGSGWEEGEQTAALVRSFQTDDPPEVPPSNGGKPGTTTVALHDPAICDEIRGGLLPPGYIRVVLGDGDLPDHNGTNEAVVGTDNETRDVVRLGDEDVFCGDAGGDEANIIGGAPTMHGETGDDEVRLIGDSAGGTFLGGPGRDRVRYAALTVGVKTVFDDDGSGRTTWPNGGHLLDSIEWWAGTESDDSVDASRSPARMALFGLGGDDVLIGTAFGDSIEGGLGENRIDGRGDLDHIRSIGSDTIDGGGDWHQDIVDFRNIVDGAITLTVASDGMATVHGPMNRVTTVINFRQIVGTAGADRLEATGSPHPVFLSGVGGNDVLTGGAGSDRLAGGPGDDSCRPGPGDTIEGCER